MKNSKEEIRIQTIRCELESSKKASIIYSHRNIYSYSRAEADKLSTVHK